MSIDNTVENKQPTKTTLVDRQEKYRNTWWPLFIALVILYALFFIVSAIAAAQANATTFEPDSVKSILLANGSLILILFIAFWICSFIMNPLLDLKLPKFTTPETSKKAHLINYFNIAFIVGFMVTTILCAALFLGAGCSIKTGGANCASLATAGTVLYSILFAGCCTIYFFIVYWKNQIV